MLPQLVDMAKAASGVDSLLNNMLEGNTDVDIPRLDMGRGVECCPELPVTRQQRTMVRVSIQSGGDEVHGGHQLGSLHSVAHCP